MASCFFREGVFVWSARAAAGTPVRDETGRNTGRRTTSRRLLRYHPAVFSASSTTDAEWAVRKLAGGYLQVETLAEGSSLVDPFKVETRFLLLR